MLYSAEINPLGLECKEQVKNHRQSAELSASMPVISCASLFGELLVGNKFFHTDFLLIWFLKSVYLAGERLVCPGPESKYQLSRGVSGQPF